MAISTETVVFLGNFADADTNESTRPIEVTSVYLQNFGSAANPLYQHQTDITFDDVNNNNSIQTDNISPNETITYDLGSGLVSAEVDSLAVVSIQATYKNGTTQSYNNVVMFQDNTGNLWLANSNFAGTDINGPAPLESVNVTNIASSDYDGLFTSNFQQFICFAQGTQISTPGGLRSVEALRIGDLVTTRDRGAQPLRWCGASVARPGENSAPVIIRAGALGAGIPSRDLIVSRQHRVMIASPVAARMFGDYEILVPAHTLAGHRGIERGSGTAFQAFYHLLLDHHELLSANGAWSESLYWGPEALRVMGKPAQDALAHRLPRFRNPAAHEPVRQFVRGRPARTLLQRLEKNSRPLCEMDAALCPA